MARLRYSCICSLDGYVNDATGSFDWSAPDPEVHRFVNAQEEAVGTCLYGRRMYETMRVWDRLPAGSPETDAFAGIWQASDKIVYSTTLAAVTTRRTRLERSFDPAAVRALADAADRDVSIGGATLAGHALAAGIVDDVSLFLVPHLAGGGTPALPDGLALDLELADECRFANGTVFVGYHLPRRQAISGAGELSR